MTPESLLSQFWVTLGLVCPSHLWVISILSVFPCSWEETHFISLVQQRSVLADYLALGLDAAHAEVDKEGFQPLLGLCSTWGSGVRKIGWFPRQWFSALRQGERENKGKSKHDNHNESHV